MAIMYRIVFTSVLFLGSAYSRDACPGFITCETSEKQSSCPKGTFYRERVKVYWCCPGCVELKDIGQPCNIREECQPGLTCSEHRQCEKDPSQACEYYKRYDLVWTRTKYWEPYCLPDGTYAPIQCKGEKMAGKCFCVNVRGHRIFGEVDWSLSQNMTCACSRKAEAMRENGLEVNLHCDHLGNFEPLQCDRELCWCANPISGIPYTVMVPTEMMISLPCYNGSAVGVQYHRQCDSTNHMQEVITSLLWNHGTTGITFASQNCGFDGSYHRVQPFREKKRCVFINNIPLTEAVNQEDIDCNCAYDKRVAELRQTKFFAECLPNGNYRSRQIWNEKVYCVDKDGFYFSSDPQDCPSN